MSEDLSRAHGADRGADGGLSGGLRAAHRLTVGTLTTVYVAVALLGSLGAGLAVLVLVVPLSGLLGGVVARGVHRALHPGRDVPLSHHLPAAVGTGLFVPFVTGMETLGEGGSYLLVVLMILCTVAGVGWAYAVEPDTVGPPPSAPQRLPEAELSSLRDLLAALPVDELLHEWRWSRQRLSTDPHRALQLRELLLEEMQQRDPAGFRAWLLDGLERDPGHHIHGDDAGGATTGRPSEPGR